MTNNQIVYFAQNPYPAIEQYANVNKYDLERLRHAREVIWGSNNLIFPLNQKNPTFIKDNPNIINDINNKILKK